jgi:hypothetical protein
MRKQEQQEQEQQARKTGASSFTSSTDRPAGCSETFDHVGDADLEAIAHQWCLYHPAPLMSFHDVV